MLGDSSSSIITLLNFRRSQTTTLTTIYNIMFYLLFILCGKRAGIRPFLILFSSCWSALRMLLFGFMSSSHRAIYWLWWAGDDDIELGPGRAAMVKVQFATPHFYVDLHAPWITASASHHYCHNMPMGLYWFIVISYCTACHQVWSTNAITHSEFHTDCSMGFINNMYVT